MGAADGLRAVRGAGGQRRAVPEEGCRGPVAVTIRLKLVQDSPIPGPAAIQQRGTVHAMRQATTAG